VTAAVRAYEEARRRAVAISTWRLVWWIRWLRRRVGRSHQNLDMARLAAVEGVCRDRTGAVPPRRRLYF
jgi:hypothetical protein